MICSIVNRPAIGNYPSTEWLHLLQSGLLRAAPEGFTQVFTGMSGSDVNEAAYKAAFMWRAQQDRGGADIDFSNEEVRSVMSNQSPGSPNYSILSFSGGFHGRLFGSLSTTRSKPIHKLDIPAFDWPSAPFPKLKYPLEEHTRENAAEEARCLEVTEDLIKNFHNPVAAVVVEPIRECNPLLGPFPSDLKTQTHLVHHLTANTSPTTPRIRRRRQPCLPRLLPIPPRPNPQTQHPPHRGRSPNRRRRHRRILGPLPLEPTHAPGHHHFLQESASGGVLFPRPGPAAQ